MTNIKAVEFVNQGSSLEKAAGTLKELVDTFDKQQFALGKPKGQGNLIHQSKAGNWQILFVNTLDTTKRVYLRISDNLHAAIIGGESVKLETSPVYITYPNDPATGKPYGTKMLVAGMAGAEVEIVKNGLAALSAADFIGKPEPSTAD